jgi:hypothetical protein
MGSKNLITFYLLHCWFCITSQTNSLVVISESGQPFFLSLNSDPVNKTLQSNVKAFQLAQGWNTVQISMPINGNELKLTDSIQVIANPKYADKEFTYALIEKKGRLYLKFVSVSERSGPERPPVPEAPKETIPLIDNNLYGNLYRAVNNKPQFFDNYNEATSACEVGLSDKEMKYALTLMEKVNDKETSYRYLNSILDNNCFTVLQVKTLLEAVSNDMDKLNSAKKSYAHITDKENIRILLNLFRYAAMKESFTSFLNDQENIEKQKKLQCKDPVNSNKLEEIYTRIKNTPYENEKIALAKKIMVNVCLSTNQVKKLGELIVHDREKIEFFKSAFYVLTDKENTETLAEEFQFAESKTEYLKFISQQK